MQNIHGLAIYTVLNPTKAAGGVWWIWYSSKYKASMAWLYTQSWIQQKQPVEFDGFGTVANANHPWLGYTQSWIQQQQPVEFDGFGTVANAKHPWLGYTQSWIQQQQPVEFDGFGTHGYKCTCPIHWAILWSTESIKIRQNQEKDFGGFGVVRVKWDNETQWNVSIFDREPRNSLAEF